MVERVVHSERELIDWLLAKPQVRFILVDTARTKKRLEDEYKVPVVNQIRIVTVPMWSMIKMGLPPYAEIGVVKPYDILDEILGTPFREYTIGVGDPLPCGVVIECTAEEKTSKGQTLETEGDAEKKTPSETKGDIQ